MKDISSDEYKLKEIRSLWLNKQKLFRDRFNTSKFLKRQKNKRERSRWKQGKEETYGKYRGYFW